MTSNTQSLSGLRVVGYARVSTQAQGEKGYGLAAQQDVMRQYCAANGLQLLTITYDVVSGGSVEKMHGRATAIAAIESGLADALLVRALDRATRDQLDAASIFKRANKNGWRLLDCDRPIPATRASVSSRISGSQWPQRRSARSVSAPERVCGGPKLKASTSGDPRGSTPLSWKESWRCGSRKG